MAPVPTLQDLAALAERALGFVEGESQVTAWWERRIAAGPLRSEERTGIQVEVVTVDDGRVGAVRTDALGDDGLSRAAEGAARRARESRGPGGAGGLPEQTPGRPHEGWDPALLSLDPAGLDAAPADRMLDPHWLGGAARTVVVSTRGVQAAEQRTFASLRLGGPHGQVAAAAVGPAAIAAEELADEARALADEGAGSPLPAEPAVVLGPQAVARALRRLAPEFGLKGALGAGAVGGRLGTRVAAPSINLSDSARFAGQLPRSYDVEGVPTQPVPLIQDGVAHRVVLDTATAGLVGGGAASTGHATLPGAAAAEPRHLVLVGGGAASVDELCAPIARGLYVHDLAGPVLELIEDGRRTGRRIRARVAAEPLDILAAAEALTVRQRTIAHGTESARTAGATVCPALRAAPGAVRIVG